MSDQRLTKGMIHVALCCDENYAAYATVVMLSVLEHASTPGHFLFHLISNNINLETQKKIQGEVTSKGSAVKIYEATNNTFDGLPVHRFGQAVYQRILLGEYLSSEIARIIYLDSDLIIRDDLTKLWEIDLEGKPVAAVEDLSNSACETIGVPRKEYFNSGVLVLDLAQWREQRIHWQVAEYAAEHSHRLHYVDQCSLNAILHSNWARLPPRWNAQANVYKILKKYSEGSGYTVRDLEDAVAWPAIIHFTGKKKPWLQHCFHPYKGEFMEVFEKIGWAKPHPSRTDFQERARYFFALRDHWKNAGRKRTAAKLRSSRARPLF